MSKHPLVTGHTRRAPLKKCPTSSIWRVFGDKFSLLCCISFTRYNSIMVRTAGLKCKGPGFDTRDRPELLTPFFAFTTYWYTIFLQQPGIIKIQTQGNSRQIFTKNAQKLRNASYLPLRSYPKDLFPEWWVERDYIAFALAGVVGWRAVFVIVVELEGVVVRPRPQIQPFK
jgi:hypothetical protein